MPGGAGRRGIVAASQAPSNGADPAPRDSPEMSWGPCDRSSHPSGTEAGRSASMTCTVRRLPLRSSTIGRPSPGRWRATTSSTSAIESTGSPSTETITSPPATLPSPRIPARAAGPSGSTSRTRTPERPAPSETSARGPSPALIPRYAWLTLRWACSDGSSALAVSIGTAKPSAVSPCGPSASIWELTPMTRPAASSSGPPALPGLSTPSVWMTLLTEKPLGAVMRRCLADTMPVVSVRSRPNGLRIEIVGSPTRPEREALGLHPEQRQVGLLVLAEHARRHGLLVGERHGDVGGSRDDVGVGEQPALFVDHEAGRARDAVRTRGEVHRGGARLQRAGAHEHDAGGVARVDLAGGRATAALRGRAGARAERGRLHDGARPAAAGRARAEHDGRRHTAADQPGGE